MPQGKFASTNEKQHLDLGGEASSAPKFNVRRHSSHISRTFQLPAVIFQELYDLGKCYLRVEFHDFPGFPGLLLIYPNTILIHVAILFLAKSN